MAGGKRGRAAHPPGSRVENLQRSSVAEESSATASESPCGSKAMTIGRSGRLMLADYLVGLGVEQGHGTVCVADREGFPVGAQRERGELLAVRA